jgi:hypothetical protein
MDSRTPRFDTPYVGNFVGGQGEFFREWETPQGKRTGRITFSDITTDSVYWELAISSDEGHTFPGLHTKPPTPQPHLLPLGNFRSGRKDFILQAI